MKPSDMLANLRTKTAEELKGVDPKSRKFITTICNIDKKYGKELDKQFINKDELVNKINNLENVESRRNFRCGFESCRKEILKLLEE